MTLWTALNLANNSLSSEILDLNMPNYGDEMEKDSHTETEEDINSEDDLIEEDIEENNQVKKRKRDVQKAKTNVVYDILKNLNEEQREVEREMGFEALFNINPFDCLEKCLEVHITCIRITEGDVHCILGLPKGEIDIQKLVCKGADDLQLERKLKITLGKDKMIQMPTLKKSLLGIKSNSLEFKVKSMNWCKHVAHMLPYRIKARDRSGHEGTLGCIPLLAFMYFERFSLVGEEVIPYKKCVVLRIGDWDTTNLRRRKEIPIVDAINQKGIKAIHTSKFSIRLEEPGQDLFTIYEDPRLASMAEWLKRPTHNWRIRRCYQENLHRCCKRNWTKRRLMTRVHAISHDLGQERTYANLNRENEKSNFKKKIEHESHEDEGIHVEMKSLLMRIALALSTKVMYSKILFNSEKCGRLTNSTKVFKCVTEDDYGGDIDACEKIYANSTVEN
ncbi:hypothetical protein M9H77_26666 [Catharanthus roseus]|uniref:Uncharacterized protein n=1 Tax=Catharanthus roseus TaxID=4058 RepID=A0ACC0AD12_CATRO|nr:hypothetical protein M9H77_26666 [Catharanthus roseus]